MNSGRIQNAERRITAESREDSRELASIRDCMIRRIDKNVFAG
jgi:hypothetical protein